MGRSESKTSRTFSIFKNVFFFSIRGTSSPPVLRDNFNYSGFLITNKKNRETKLINFMQLMRSSYPVPHRGGLNEKYGNIN